MSGSPLIAIHTLTKTAGCVWESPPISFCGATVHFRLTRVAAADWRLDLVEGATVRVTWLNTTGPTEIDGVCSWTAPGNDFLYDSDDGNEWCDWGASGTVVVENPTP